jgi:hypothetical protein
MCLYFVTLDTIHGFNYRAQSKIRRFVTTAQKHNCVIPYRLTVRRII